MEEWLLRSKVRDGLSSFSRGWLHWIDACHETKVLGLNLDFLRAEGKVRRVNRVSIKDRTRESY